MSHTKKSLMKTTFTPRSHELEHIKPWSLQNFLNHSNMNTLFCVFMCFIVSISTASQIRNRFKYSLLYSCSLTIDYVVWTVCTPWVRKGLAAVGWDLWFNMSYCMVSWSKSWFCKYESLYCMCSTLINKIISTVQGSTIISSP